MKKENLVAVDEFCAYHNIEISFVCSLQQAGLIEITTISESWFVHTNQLQKLEKYIRFYYELDINLEGIETITYLLDQINSLHDEVNGLKNHLRLFENPNP